MKTYIRFAVVATVAGCGLLSFGAKNDNRLRETDKAFFKTEEARRIGDQVLVFQRVTGGWPKNVDMCSPLNEEQLEKVVSEKDRDYDSTTDNNATMMQLRYLARLYQATKDEKYGDAFRRGVRYLLSGQYENGGWPQFWPKMRGYQIHITYNDNAMVNTMNLLNDIYIGKYPFKNGLVTDGLRDSVKTAFDKGIECILETQIKKDGELTVWCQQHDRETLKPASARAYELPSFCSMESAEIVRLLMKLPEPDKRVRTAVNSAMRWFEEHKITGMRLVRDGKKGDPDYNTRLVEDSSAEPLWARYYDLDNVRPFVCDRDGIPRERLEDIGLERRNGYSWFSSRPSALFPLYEKWKIRVGE